MKIEKAEQFCSSFLDHYLATGFGSLQKRDIDLLVLHLILEDGQYEMPRDIFKACRGLKLTETKMRNLYQDVQIKYQQYDEKTAKKKFIELIITQSFERKGKSEKITFIVRDPMLRQYFEEWVANEKGFTDSSFNKDLVTIHRNTLLAILESLATKKEFDEIEGQLPKELKRLGKFNSIGSFLGELVAEIMKPDGKDGGSLIEHIGSVLKIILLS